MKRLLSIESPHLIKEWSDKNEVSCGNVTVGSHLKIWWKGGCGHEWEAVVKNRVKGAGCPYCSGNKILKGFNDLTTLFPDVASEWSEDNYPLKPEMFTAKCNKEVRWRCKNGHEWKARIADRTDGHGCPVCSRQSRINKIVYDVIKPEYEIGSVWSENNNISIKEASASPRRMYLWKCGNCGEEFRASVGYMLKGAVCSSCRKKNSEQNYRNMLEMRKDDRSKRFRLPLQAFEYYAVQTGLQFFKDDDSIIGIPFQYFLPKYRAVVEFSERRDCSSQHRRRKGVVNELCLRTKTKMIRILDSSESSYKDCLCISRVDDSYEGISEALDALFGILHIDIDVDVERDLGEIISLKEA